MRIIIDADACPKNVLQICFAVGEENNLAVWTVANYNHRIISPNHIAVGRASQEADLKIVNMAEVGDVVITQDWGLAAMVLGKGAKCLSPNGKEYTENNIDFMLEEREIKARLRRSGGRTKGPSKRTSKPDKRFEYSLRQLIK